MRNCTMSPVQEYMTDYDIMKRFIYQQLSNMSYTRTPTHGAELQKFADQLGRRRKNKSPELTVTTVSKAAQVKEMSCQVKYISDYPN